MTIILDTLKKTLDKIALLVKHGVKSMFHFESNLVWNTNLRSMFFKVIADFIARVSFVGVVDMSGTRNDCLIF